MSMLAILLAASAPTAPIDHAAMQSWVALNDLCAGSSDRDTIQTACPARERLGQVLERRGWCWAYTDWRVTPGDYRWHDCRMARP